MKNINQTYTKNKIKRLLANALYSQLPILVLLPPKESIASFISLAFQMGNIFIPLYLFLNGKSIVTAYRCVLFILLFAIVTSYMYTITWESFSPEQERERTVSILTLSFFSGICGCLSNVSFWEFASNYHPKLISALALGNAGSSIFPVLFTLIQSPGPEPRFDLSVFFALQGIPLIASMISFLLIRYSSLVKNCRRENWSDESRKLLKQYKSKTSIPDVIDSQGFVHVSSQNLGSDDQESNEPRNSSLDRPKTSFLSPKVSFASEQSYRSLSTSSSVRSNHFDNPEYLLRDASTKGIELIWRELLIMVWISFLSYFILGIITCLLQYFENWGVILMYYTIAHFLGGILGRLVTAFFQKCYHLPLLLYQLALTLTFFFGPLMKDNRWYAWMLVAFSFFLSLQFGFQSTMLFKNGASHLSSTFSQKICRWLGVAEQIGAFLSGILAFVLVYCGAFNY